MFHAPISRFRLFLCQLIKIIATIQRLGYILDDILEQKEIAEVLHSELLTYVKRFRYIPLSTHKTDENAEKNTRWKVYINSIIETDEI